MLRAVALLAVVSLASGCDVLLPPPQVVTQVRDPSGLVVTCTGDPLPTTNDCRDQGEQALSETTRAGDPITRLAVEFGTIREDRCQTVSWVTTYASGDRVMTTTEVCQMRRAKLTNYPAPRWRG